MAQTKDETKRLAIRDAVIADVVENGLSKAPISRIAQHAGVSAGTIYIYYPNKNEMLQSIFLEIKSLMHGTMMDAHHSGSNSTESIRLMWFAMFRFILEKPNMFAFHEAIDAEKLLSSHQRVELTEMAIDIHKALSAAIDDGTVKDMPMDCLVSLLLAPAVSLARRMLAGNSKDVEKANCVFEAIWNGIANVGK